MDDKVIQPGSRFRGHRVKMWYSGLRFGVIRVEVQCFGLKVTSPMKKPEELGSLARKPSPDDPSAVAMLCHEKTLLYRCRPRLTLLTSNLQRFQQKKSGLKKRLPLTLNSNPSANMACKLRAYSSVLPALMRPSKPQTMTIPPKPQSL